MIPDDPMQNFAVLEWSRDGGFYALRCTRWPDVVEELEHEARSRGHKVLVVSAADMDRLA